MRPGVDVERTDVMRLLRFLLLCAFAASARAEEPPAQEPARFLIETITVEAPGKHAAGIIESETLLEEGGTYTEDDLRRAVARIHRLPFVLDATFSLRKGSERGAYELFIQADTARWFFFDRTVHFFHFEEPYTLGTLGGDTSPWSHTGLIGGRVFTGRSGVLYGSLGFQSELGDDSNGARIGYTHYNLFGRGIAVDLSYAGHCCSTEVLPFGIDPQLTSWDWVDDGQASLKLSIPLAAHRSIQLGWTERSGEAQGRQQVLEPVSDTLFRDVVLDGDQDSRHLEARWIQDTRDDPILPSRGTVLSAGVEHDSYQAENLRAERFVRDPEGIIVSAEEVDVPDFDGEQILATAAAGRIWSVTPRQSVSAGGQISAGRSQLTGLTIDGRLLPETDLELYGVAVRAGHLLRIWALREPGILGDVYLDTTLTYSIERTSPGLGLEDNPLERLDLTAALVYRCQWGRLRLAFTYLNLGEVLR